MFHVQHIDSLDLPELAPYRTMKRPVAHEAQGIFVAESEKVVRRLLESDFDVVSVLLPTKWLPHFESLLRVRREDIPVFVVEKKQVLEELVGFSMFQGIMAVGRIPTPISLNDAVVRSSPPRLFVALDALANAENLGVLVRNGVAFGIHALVVGETSASPFLRRAVRNSMGTIFRLPVVESANLVRTLEELRQRGFRCVAAHPHATGRTLTQVNFSSDCCIVMGSEGDGISSPVLAACDDAVAIPMPPFVDSLNVGSASAVFLYEANRQRSRI